MKIIIAIPLYPPEIDPLANYAKKLAEQLAENNQVTVLAYTGKTLPVKNFNLITIDKDQPLLLRLWRFTWQLLKLAETADLIIAQNAVAAGLPAIIAKRLRRRPVIINFSEDEAWKRALALGFTEKSLADFLQNPGHNKKTKQLVKMQRWTLRQADQVIVPDENLAKLAVKNYQVLPEKIIINPLPPVAEEILPFPASKIKQQIYLQTKLYEWANLANLFSALSLLVKDWPEIKLYLAGEGRGKNDLQKLAKQLNLADRVIFLGVISSAQDQYLSKTSALHLKNIANFSVTELAEEIKTALAKDLPPAINWSWNDHLTALNKALLTSSENND